MPSDKPLVLDQEDKLLRLFPRPPLLTSFQAGWDGIMLAYRSHLTSFPALK